MLFKLKLDSGEGAAVICEDVSDEEFVHYVAQIVNDWLVDDARPHFSALLRNKHPDHNSRLAWHLSPAQRRSFTTLAMMVRLGQGHVTANPDPLYAVLQEKPSARNRQRT